MQEVRHIRRGLRLRFSLRPAINVRGKHHRRIGRWRVEIRKGIFFRHQGIQTGDAEIHLAIFVFVIFEPLPSDSQRFAVHRILLRATHRFGLTGADENFRPCFDVPAHAVQAAEALAQGIEACAFGHQSVEVEVCTHFQGLSGDDDDRPFQMAVDRLIRMEFQV